VSFPVVARRAIVAVARLRPDRLMARNTAVAAETAAPPVTRRLAELVVSHPSAGWNAQIDAEARRTISDVGRVLGALLARGARPDGEHR